MSKTIEVETAKTTADELRARLLSRERVVLTNDQIVALVKGARDERDRQLEEAWNDRH